MKLTIRDGPLDGAVIELQPGKFTHQGLPADLAKRLEAELREPRVFRTFEAQEQGTDASSQVYGPVLETAAGIDFAALAVVRRMVPWTVVQSD